MLIFFIFSVPDSKHFSVDCNGGGRGGDKDYTFQELVRPNVYRVAYYSIICFQWSITWVTCY